MRAIFWTCLLLVAQAAQADPPMSKHIAKLLAGHDGKTRENAIKVGSVPEEYEVAAALGLKVVKQSLDEIDKKPYDRLKVVDAVGNTSELWFDISRFFPEI
jgi:hypothetical protein